MRQSITLKKTGKGWELVSDPSVPYDKQRADFNASPAKHTDNGDVEQIKLVRLDKDSCKTRHYNAAAKPKAAKKKAAKKEA
jgi:hypothetical protein